MLPKKSSNGGQTCRSSALLVLFFSFCKRLPSRFPGQREQDVTIDCHIVVRWHLIQANIGNVTDNRWSTLLNITFRLFLFLLCPSSMFPGQVKSQRKIEEELLLLLLQIYPPSLNTMVELHQHNVT